MAIESEQKFLYFKILKQFINEQSETNIVRTDNRDIEGARLRKGREKQACAARARNARLGLAD